MLQGDIHLGGVRDIQSQDKHDDNAFLEAQTGILLLCNFAVPRVGEIGRVEDENTDRTDVHIAADQAVTLEIRYRLDVQHK